MHLYQNLVLPQDTSLQVGDLSLANGATFQLGGGSTLTVDDALSLTGSSNLIVAGKNTSAQVSGAWAGVGSSLQAGQVTIESGSSINADGQGYTTGMGPGGSSNFSVGGTYGGHGSSSSSAVTYGSPWQPVDLGSAGGGAGGGWSNGGGAIHLVVQHTLQLDGQIRANTTSYYNSSGAGTGGGAGGSIWLEVDTLSGSGSINANGGHPNNGVGSGGGRVAVYYQHASGFSGFTSSSASAGAAGAENGSLVFMDQSITHGHLHLYQNLVLPQDTSLQVGDLSLANGATFQLGGGSTLTVDDALSLTGSSTVVVGSKNIDAQVNGVWVGVGATLQADRATIEAGSSINAEWAGLHHRHGSRRQLEFIGGRHLWGPWRREHRGDVRLRLAAGGFGFRRRGRRWRLVQRRWSDPPGRQALLPDGWADPRQRHQLL